MSPETPEDFKMHSEYTPPHPKPSSPGPRNPIPPDFTHADLLAALQILSRREAARRSRLSSITRLRGGL